MPMLLNSGPPLLCEVTVLFLNLYFSYVYICVSTGANGGQKKVSCSQELELQMFVSLHVDAGN